jgi:hypothetical protein
VRIEGVGKLKKKITAVTSPTTLRLVAQCLNQLAARDIAVIDHVRLAGAEGARLGVKRLLNLFPWLNSDLMIFVKRMQNAQPLIFTSCLTYYPSAHHAFLLICCSVCDTCQMV